VAQHRYPEESMKTPRFTVVVPTRNRPETLPHALRTVLEQDVEELEILVVDNASDVDIEPIVASMGDARIRYVRRVEPLAMTDNWNRILPMVQGDWVMFLGDDDGLARGALRTIETLAKQFGVRAMRWDWGRYTWPDLPESSLRDRLGIPLFGTTQLRDWPDVVRRLATEDADAELPFLYHAVVARSLIEEAAATGPIFDGPIPDLHSGVLFAHFEMQFLHVGLPLTITAWSGTSNTAGQLGAEAPNRATVDFEQLNRTAGHVVHHELPDLITNRYVAWWDPILRVRDRLGLTEEYLFPSPEDVVQGVAKHLHHSGDRRERELDVLRGFAQRSGLDPLGLEIPPGHPTGPQLLPNGGIPFFGHNFLQLDSARHKVRDVNGAAALMADVLEMGDALSLIREAGDQQVADVHAALAELHRAHEETTGWYRAAAADRDDLAQQVRVLKKRNDELARELRLIRGSRSWRATALLRQRPWQR
jgi:hypothetical protein